MAKRAPKNKGFPRLDGIEIVERLGDGIGAGRFHATLKDGKQPVDVLMLRPGGDSAIEWASRFKTLESVNIPRVLALGSSDGPPWVAVAVPEGVTLGQWLSDNGHQTAEIDALNIIMQVAMALQVSHSEEIAHGQLDADSIVLESMDGGLHRVHIVGWTPPVSSDDAPDPIKEDPRALGQLLYMLITGVLPPSAQTENVENLEGDSTGAFDDVLMDWIDEERDLKGLGQPAMQALADGDSFESISAFVEELLPHFSQHLSATINETGDALEADRAFMVEVERQRLRLKELQTRERFIRDWLGDHLDRIDECEGQLENYRARLRGLENLQADVALRLGVHAERATRAIDDVLAAWAPDDAIELLNLDQAALPAGEVLDLERGGIDVSQPPEPETPDVPLVDIDPPSSDHQASVEIAPSAPPSRPRFGLLSIIAGILTAAVLGALGTMWFLQSDQVRVPEPPKPPPEQVSATSGNPATAVTAQPARTSPPVGEAANPAVAAQPERDASTPVTAARADAQVRDSEKPVAEASQTVPKEPALKIFTGAKLAPPPPGMVAVRGGRLNLGLGAEQVRKIVEICREDRARYRKVACDKLTDEMNGETAEIPSFYLDRTEVSQSVYDRCVRAKKCRSIRTRWELKSQPATGLTRDNATAYCAWRGKRLPTHREWLYAVRGPDSSTLFPWGDEGPLVGKTARANSGRFVPGGGRADRRDRNKYAGPVEIFKNVESPFGAINLAGNVREWTSTGGPRDAIVVGGGWQNAPYQLRSSRIDRVKATKFGNDLGFRCALSPSDG